ncbi:hypothetical protein [Agromyces ramosus]|uniref:Type VII secretion protein EccE n=1 Tax=Agromyces ramosus TaxID=33879 RepID=A0ABU0RC63_9MICO|nr:hypothetical protein [Agromyces ramosus]MDQ0895658.1 hypothetical protein [Agromyces ramosus]
MPAPRSKPLLAWEPLPYFVLFVLVVAVSLVRPERAPWGFWPLLVLVVLVAAWLVRSIMRDRRPANPDRWGDLSSLEGLDGLEVVDAPAVDRAVRSVVPVVDTERHQAAIELARLHGGAEQAALLVPRASRWMSRRYRIGVQLVGGDRPRHAGFLGTRADDRWRDVLDAARMRGVLMRVPALVTRDARPFGVELDLSGLARLEEAA